MALFSRKAPSKASVVSSPTGATAVVAAGHEGRIQTLGRELLDRARKHKTGLLSREFYSNALMEWSMKDPSFKVQMFRFVDCFPMLKDSEQIYDHLTDYLSQPGVSVPPVIATALKAGSIAKGLAAKTIASQIEGMAGKFIAGQDAASALAGLKELWKDGIAFSVDLLGEACVSDAEADEYQKKYLDLIQNLPAAVGAWGTNERLERDHLGGIPRVNVSIKVSSLSARCDPIDTEGSINDLMRRLVPILETARDRGVFVNFDMEQFALKDLTIELFQRCCEKVDFHAGLAMQAYLRSGVDDAHRVSEWAKRTGRVVTVRLVKGAYWDYETIKAEQMGWPSPVWAKKHETDACFERMTGVFLDAGVKASAEATAKLGPTRVAAGAGGIKLALGSHNARSIAAALAGLESRGLARNAIELQMLHGMADQLKHAAAEMDLRVREYVPVGEMIPGMAYLVRRLLENTSNESWLKAGFLEGADPAVLLADPAQASGQRGAKASNENGHASHAVPPELALSQPERHALSPAREGVGDGRPFMNESMRDFSRREVREGFARAIAGARVPAPGRDGSVEDAKAMVARASAIAGQWRDFDPARRAKVLVRAAAAMRARRDELSGIMVREAGKTWREADADTCEAIDFCEYYARLSVPMFERRRMGKFIGELDEQWYQARGVAVVISPWNFPLAICCGMTAAALVTGNPVIVKPAEQTPGIARAMADVLVEALRAEGAPADALQYCAGPGETVGAALVRDPRVALIAFTGSRDVGLDILHAAAPMSPFTPGVDRAAYDAFVRGEHAHVKRVICEMGGKNAAIIDTSADIDEAVLGVRQSAFGFQGQKCSAASRVIVVDPAGERGPAITNFLRRFVEATKALTIGDPMLPGTDIGPVIDAEAKSKILRYAELGTRESTLELAMRVPDGLEQKTGRHYVGPHIFSRVRPEHAIWRDEIFGPVVGVMHAASFDEALALANASPYKLTGGVFSRKPSHLEQAKRDFRVGNLYLNRGITGALVARQPFGGFGMSGVGSKAGGADYLLQFVEPRACSENTLRRGFAPEL